MSTFYRSQQKCSICKKKSDFTLIGSTNAFGSSDLDLRPPEMQRSTMRFWVHECPRCGYVSEQISDKSAVHKEFLKSEEYRTNNNGINFDSQLASLFYKQHLINQYDGNERGSFFALLHASWACDDVGDTEKAIQCRILSLQILTSLIEQNPKDKEQLIVLKADIMRRALLFDDLIASFSLIRLSQELLNRILSFQLSLARKKDAECYTVDSALEYEETQE